MFHVKVISRIRHVKPKNLYKVKNVHELIDADWKVDHKWIQLMTRGSTVIATIK